MKALAMQSSLHPIETEEGRQHQNASIQIAISAQPHENQDGGLTHPPQLDYMARAQWLRAALLGASDGLVSVASLMVGVGAVSKTPKAMLVSGLAGAVAGACSMAIGEFVSVYAQYDIEVAQMKRNKRDYGRGDASDVEAHRLPSPSMAAAASALSFAFGAILPLLAGGFIHPWWIRLVVVCGVTSLGLAAFGAAGAVLGGANLWKSTVRVLVGGWLAMLVTYGVLKFAGHIFGIEVTS